MFIDFVEYNATYRFLILKNNVPDYNTIIEIKNAEFIENVFL